MGQGRRQSVEETAGLIPDCALVWLEGVGHLKAATSKRIAGHLLAFVNRDSGPGLPGPGPEF